MNDTDGPRPPWFVGMRTDAPPLTHERIVKAAHELVHAEGADALSLRALAKRLGIGTSQLHRRIQRKEHLLIAVADLVLSEVPIPETATSARTWRASLRRFSLDIRASLEDHPHVHPVLDTYVLVTPGAVVIAERALSTLRAGGFRGPALTDAYNAWAGYVFGFSVIEMQPRQQRRDREQLRRWVRSYLKELDPGRFPTITAELPHLENQAFGLRWEAGALGPKGASFTVGLDAMIEGLEARRKGRRTV